MTVTLLKETHMHYKIALIGFGNVARALARLLVRKRDLLKSKYDLTFSFTGLPQVNMVSL